MMTFVGNVCQSDSLLLKSSLEGDFEITDYFSKCNYPKCIFAKCTRLASKLCEFIFKELLL